MKRSLRVPFTLLLLVAVGTVLTLRALLSRELGPADAPATAQPMPNATLVRLASAEIGEAEIRKDVEELLDGNFAGLDPGRSRYRALPLRRRGTHFEARPRSSIHLPIRLRSPKDFRIFPEFRRSLRDWLRLRRFQPSIMSQLTDLVKSPIDLHNGLLPSGQRYSSCAVVGNGGILLKSDNGELIDSHELVIRLNNARTEGYHRNVGSKTGLSFVNSNILHLCARRESCFCHPYGETVPIIMYICQPAHFLDYTVCNASHKAPLLITDPRFDILCSRIVKYYSLKRFVEETGRPPAEWSKVHEERAFHYSSGMQAVMLAFGICDQVSVFGFGKSADAKHHYHTNQKKELDLHDYEAEYAFYRDLVKRPQVIPFLKDSRFKVPPVVFYQ